MGWCIGEIKIDGATVAGGPDNGQVNGPSAFGVFQIAADSNSVTLNDHAGDLPSAISDNHLNTRQQRPARVHGSSHGCHHSREARNERKGYEGSFGLAILRRPIDDDDASCLYKEGAGMLAV